MIPRTVPTWQIQSWQDELKQLIDTPEKLIEAVGLDQKWLPAARRASMRFPVHATKSFVRRIEKGNPNDPLLRQILPMDDELRTAPGYVHDPLQEKQFTPVPGVIHKYRSRVLLIAATQCAINCRYCFRRHFPYNDNRLSKDDWRQALNYIAHNTDLNEVILSGGDPLSLGDRQLAWISQSLAKIPHIKRLRIHSRFPIILPSRITQEFVRSITHPSLDTIMVIHCNHPQEIDFEVREAAKNMREAKIILFNQAVLLKNINDNSTIQASLSEVLFSSGILPYYLHLLDPVEGASHFAVTEPEAKLLYKQLLAKLPGYLVPKLVRELPNEESKTPVGFL